MAKYHMVCSISGLLSGCTNRQLKNIINLNSDEAKRLKTGADIREYLEQRMADGDKYIACGECPTFSAVHGCQCNKEALTPGPSPMKGEGSRPGAGRKDGRTQSAPTDNQLTDSAGTASCSTENKEA